MGNGALVRSVRIIGQEDEGFLCECENRCLQGEYRSIDYHLFGGAFPFGRVFEIVNPTLGRFRLSV